MAFWPKKFRYKVSALVWFAVLDVMPVLPYVLPYVPVLAGVVRLDL